MSNEMREILFRGKRKDNGEWIEGYFVYTKSDYDAEEEREADIIPHDADRVYPGEYNYAYPCIPETIGQYTGLKDKNGTKIFEGDIVKGTFLGFPIPIEDYAFSICWQEDVAGYKANYFENVEVIGNIYDNPELLE